MGEPMKPKFTPRGFANWPEIADGHGVTIRLAESSDASGPYLWVFTEGRIGDERQNGAAHLSLEKAALLCDNLTAAIAFMEERFGLAPAATPPENGSHE